jgi:hypothetical protein
MRKSCRRSSCSENACCHTVADQHWLTLNVATFVEDQTRQQVYGMEHFALNTDDLDSVVAKLKANGARVLEQMVSGNGRRICFLEGPDGVQLEIIETQG